MSEILEDIVNRFIKLVTKLSINTSKPGKYWIYQKNFKDQPITGSSIEFSIWENNLGYSISLYNHYAESTQDIRYTKEFREYISLTSAWKIIEVVCKFGLKHEFYEMDTNAEGWYGAIGDLTNIINQALNGIKSYGIEFVLAHPELFNPVDVGISAWDEEIDDWKQIR